MQKGRTILDNVLPETRANALKWVSEGKLRSAIKLVRKATGASSSDAKEYVDGLKLEVLAQAVPPEVEGRAVGLISQGKWIEAAKAVRQDTTLGLKESKEYVDALRAGELRPRSTADGGELSARVRALKADDYESAVELVQGETGMSRSEAERFIAALE